MKEQWILNGRQADFTRIAGELSVSPLAVKLMVNRGIEEKDMRGFLSGSLSDLSDPYLMKDMKKACDILLTAAEHNDTVAIVTDYDCDGIFSGMVLYTCFNRIGIRAKLFTPDRVTEGYGLNKRIIDEAYNMGINYLITCDNGIAAADEVSYAKGLGMTVIITDHHEVPFTVNVECKEYILPKADAVIDSKQEDCAYPFKGLCGAGVVYRMACALYDRLGIKKNEREILLIYAAVATVADIMELTGENRIIVREGLKLLSHTDNIGLKAIKEVNNLADTGITPYHIGFVIGPCFNAAGRLKNVEPAFELLMSNDEKVVYDRAVELKELNEYRKDMTEEGAERALAMAMEPKNAACNVLVLYLRDCHESLIGIIAGRVKDRVHKPVIIFTDASDNTYKGSGRSIEAYSMFEELIRVKELFVKFGGHKMAAGMTIPKENFEVLRERLNNNETLTKKELTPVVRIDAEVLIRHMSIPVVESFLALAPFGNGNPKPLFAGRHFNIRQARIIGRNKNVLKCTISDIEKNVCDALYFGDIGGFINTIEMQYGTEEKDKMLRGAQNNTDVALAFNAEINEYNGIKSVQFIIQNYCIL